MKRKKSQTLAALKKALWKEISLFVRSLSAICQACKFSPVECAAHIVPANDGRATRFFLPNIYPACKRCNQSERRYRGSWVYRHREIFGEDFVDALYDFSEREFEFKKPWVIEQTERIRKLRGVA